MYKAFEYDRCEVCESKSEGCKISCEEYIKHKLAYERAVEIFNDNTLSVPKASCMGCKDRHTLCHSRCEKYMLFIEYRKIVKEAEKKQKALDSIHHLVGTPGLPKHATYNKNKRGKYVYN